LREAVESVQQQSLTDWGLVVVDDASTDGTPERVVALEDERIRLIRLERHSERGAARNHGLEAVSAKFVLFLDDDDRLLPYALERLVRPLTKSPQAVEAIGARATFDDRGHRRRAHHVRVLRTRRIWPEMLAGWFAVPGQCLFRTAVVRSVGGWSKRLVGSEDQEFQFRLSEFGPALFVPSTVLEYRAHGGQRRAYDAAHVEDTIHDEFVSRLSGDDERLARRLRQAQTIVVDEAAPAYHSRRYAQALSAYLRAIRTAPSMLVSPLTGPPLAGILAKAITGRLLGSRLAAAGHRSKAFVRRAMRRDPGEGAEKATGSSSARR
jgi:glycosyltransferase involved in cell wall biosynthesis